MALDNRLVVYNEQGEPVDYDILASDVKFSPDGKDLPTKLAELEDEIGQGGYAPPPGGIPKTDLAQSVQGSLDKADSALQDEDLADYATKTELQQGLGGKQDTINDLAAIRTGAGKGATAVQSVSVDSEEDGTVDIHVDNDKYSINLNHEHQGMAKLAKFVASNPPASMNPDTIYAQVDNLTTPTEIQSLWLFGCEFIGGIPDTGLPQVYKPISGSVIDLSPLSASGASKVVSIKARNLTNNLTVTVGTGLTVTYNGTTASSVTIPKADAILGVDVTVAYTGTAELDDGAMTVKHGTDMLASYTVTAIRVWEVLDLTQSAGRVDVEEVWTAQSSFEVQNDKRTAIVDLSGCEKLRMTASGTARFFYVPLTSVPTFGTSTSEYRSIAYTNYLPSGVSNRIEVASGATVELDIPSSWNYVAIGLQSSAANPMYYLPSYCAVK